MPTNRRRRLQPLRQGNVLTIQIRGISSLGIDHLNELDHLLLDKADVEAQLEYMYHHDGGRRRENHHLFEALERRITRNLWYADMTPGADPRIDFLREQWQQHRDAVMEYHVAKFPGTRPWAFWAFDHPGERPPGVGSSSQEGKLRELQFLIRHSLLSTEEEKAIRAEDDFREKVLDGAGALDEEEKSR